MTILEEDKLNELKTKFSELDFQDPDFVRKVEEIVNETLKGNVDKIGKLAETKTIDEALEEEKEGFEELKTLQEEGVLAELEDKDLENILNAQAEEGIKDEVAEKESLEKEGFVTEAMKKATPEDIVEEILKQLEEIIAEKKKAIDKKIEENEAMRQKVIAREKLRASRTKVSNLHQKTQNYKGTEGRKLNQNVEAAIADFDKQLEQLKTETTRDGVEMTDAILDEENKKFEEEKKSLEDMLQGMKDSYKKENAKKVKLVLIEKQIEDIASEITSDMTLEEFSKKANALREIYKGNKGDYEEEIREMFSKKTITIKESEDKEEEVTFKLGTIADAVLMDDIRETYMSRTNKEEKTEDDKYWIERSKEKFEKGKDVLEAICGDNIEEILPLMTEEEYIEQFEEFETHADKEGLFGGGKKANKVAQEMQKIYVTLAPFIGNVKTKGIIPAYNIVAEKLRNNRAVHEENLPPETLLREEKENKKPVVQRVATPMPEREPEDISQIEKGLSKMADDIAKEEAAHEEI